MSEPFDLAGLIERAQAMQRQLADAQAAAAEQVVEGSAGGGVVKISVNGGMEFTAVSIDPGAIDPSDVSMLEDLVRAACNDAVAKVHELQRQSLGALDQPGLGIPGLPGLGG